MEITVTKSIKVAPIYSLDDVFTGQDIYTRAGVQGTVTYIDLERFDVYFPSKNKTLMFVDDGIQNMFWGIFREIPDYDKITKNAIAATPAELSVTSMGAFKVNDEVVVGDNVYGYVSNVTDKKVDLLLTTPDGITGTVIITEQTPEEFLAQVKILKLH